MNYRRKTAVADAGQTRSAGSAISSTAVVLLGIAGALYYVFGTSATQQRRAAAASPPTPARCRCWSRRRQACRCAGLSRRGRHHQGAQHGHSAAAGRRQAVERRLQGRPGRQEGRCAGAHRSDHLSGRARPGGRQEGAGPGAADQCAKRSGALRTTRRHQRHQPPAVRHADDLWSRNTPRRCSPTRPLSTSAQATLAYTTIRAPIDGRTGIRAVDEGNIVRASDSTGIVTITQLKPISVLFNLPQQYLSQVNDAFAKGAARRSMR